MVQELEQLDGGVGDRFVKSERSTAESDVASATSSSDIQHSAVVMHAYSSFHRFRSN